LHQRREAKQLPKPRAVAATYRRKGSQIATNLSVILRRSLLAPILLCLLAVVARSQISPGPLSRPHQYLDSATQCTACHKLGGGQAALKCLDCHDEIASRLRTGRGLHASYHISPGSSQECARCHSEHNGLDFPLIKWDVKSFDHKQTGYALEGKHAGLACNRCHTAPHVSQSERESIKFKDLNRTFLGISTACVTCHQDKHEGRLGQNCQQCHNYNDWKITSGQFDHSKTRYPLTGLHAQVSCQKCHAPGADNKPRYLGLPFGKCSDCHSDPHRGGFAQQSCQACHNTSGWKRIATSTLNQSFDHSKTKYPLVGKHQSVDCLQCHRGGDFKRPVAFQKCMDCHKDEHEGQFIKRTDGGECASCHTVEGFKPSKFGVKEHAATAYPLEARHATVQCAQCHIPKGRETLYKVKFGRCLDCHKDEHQGQFAAAPYLNRCEQCHTLKGYRPSTFSLVQHKQTRFVLTGGHIAVPCGDCHKERSTAEAKYAALYRFEDRSCTACHADPHKGQFKDRMRQVRADGRAAGCESCHSTKSWKEVSGFDHSKTSFPLVGTHRAVACIDCHKPPNLETKLINVDFKVAPTTCEGCHANIHGTQFVKANGATPCADCHNSAKWKPSLFDHDARTSFPLQGVHRNVRCVGCHKETRMVEGKSVLFYKPTPKECAACHGAKVS
jgi:class III cytochrome C family protein